jgi:8-oxo-dGTP diphosphatase
MQCKVYELDALQEYRYVVVLSRYCGKWLLSKHKNRDTWETQGGHIEAGESPLDAAKRELFEESGATRFTIQPLCDYWAADDTSWANGMVFSAEITELGQMPESEMEAVQLFGDLPGNLTYPDITPKLFAYLEEREACENTDYGI